MFYSLFPHWSLPKSPVCRSCWWVAPWAAHNKQFYCSHWFIIILITAGFSKLVEWTSVMWLTRTILRCPEANNIRTIVASAAFATMRRSHREHCTHSTLIVHLLPSKERSCSLDSRNLGYNNKPHIRPAQSRRLFKGTVGCTFSPLNEAPTLPLRYILETDAAGCDARQSSVPCVFLFLSLRTKDAVFKYTQNQTQESEIGWGSCTDVN